MAKADQLRSKSARKTPKNMVPDFIDDIAPADGFMPPPADDDIDWALATPPNRDAIIVKDQRNFIYEGLEMTAKGMVIPADIELNGEDWVQLGNLLAGLDHAVQWAISDWMAYAEVRDLQFEGTAENGRKAVYVIAESITNYTYQTLRDYAWIATNVPVEARHADLSFSHHRAVASFKKGDMPDIERQRDWLEKAHQGGWSYKKLREEIEAATLPASTDDNRDDAANPLVAPEHRAVFKRVWKNLEKGKSVKATDLAQLRRWLDAIEQQMA